jgi:hypothetical protein
MCTGARSIGAMSTGAGGTVAMRTGAMSTGAMSTGAMSTGAGSTVAMCTGVCTTIRARMPLARALPPMLSPLLPSPDWTTSAACARLSASFVAPLQNQKNNHWGTHGDPKFFREVIIGGVGVATIGVGQYTFRTTALGCVCECGTIAKPK